MRSDADGLFWQDRPVERTNKAPVARVMPPIPDTGWRPKDFPCLKHAKEIVIDVETKDEGLNEGRGPGTHRDDSYIVGLAVGADGESWYFPMRHELGGNLDADVVLEWAGEELTRPNQPKIGANILYDLEWLSVEGVDVEGPFLDVQYAEPLIDETALSYSLDSLGLKYTGEGKVDEELYKWLARAYGGNPTRASQGGRIWRAPVSLAGPYAEGDVTLPWHVLKKQLVELESNKLTDLFNLECGLIPILLGMRKRGVRVDIGRAEEVSATMGKRIITMQEHLNSLAGHHVDVYGKNLAPIYDAQGIKYPRTPKGAPSFRKDWLAKQTDPVSEAIMEVRRLSKFKGTFIDGYILNGSDGDRIYGQFHANKSDDSGTISGRFSSSDPNLQNIPSRDPELGPLIRSMFLPEEDEDWYKSDYGQVEPRIGFHYARGPIAAAIREQYKLNPFLDCYDAMLSGMPAGIGRREVKAIYLGMSYGMGVPKLARQLGVPLEVAQRYYDQFFAGAAYIKDLADRCSDTAAKSGFIRTHLGRIRHFNMWEPRKWYSDEDKARISREKGSDYFTPVDSKEAAIAKWGMQVKRAYTYRAGNALHQGTAADIMKKAMVDTYKAGVYDVIGWPLLTVHDELDNSVPRTKEGVQAIREQKHIMETCVTLRIPLIVDLEVGPSWGEVAKVAT